MAKKEAEKPDFEVVAENRKARFDYHILEVIEAGMVLTGMEIKAIREAKINLKESYIRLDETSAWLVGAHINAYSHSSNLEYNPVRPRKLLLHKSEIDKFRGKAEQKGLTVVALKVILRRGKAKLEIGLAKGKNAPDKKKDIIAKEKKLEAHRAMKNS